MYLLSMFAFSVVLQFIWDSYKWFITGSSDTQNNFNGSLLLNENLDLLEKMQPY